MGSPDFAVPSLDALVEAGHEVVAAYASRRGRRAAARRSARRRCTSAPSSWGSRCGRRGRCAMRRSRRGFAALDADLAVVAAYGLILPKPILEAPKAGCINVHASLLPRWRGAAPIQRAILAGDEVTRRDHHADGRRARHRADAAQARRSTFAARMPAQVTEEMAKLGAQALVEWLDASDAARAAARRRRRPMPPRSTRPRRGSTGRKPAERDRAAGARLRTRRPAPGSRRTASGSSCSRPQIGERCIGQAGRSARRCADASPAARAHIRPAQGPARRRGAMSAGRAAARLSDPQGHDPAVTRWRLTVEYDGGPFMGWQRQDHGPSVQQALEEALQRMTGERRSFIAAGRTDAGVHALAMSAHVDIARALTAAPAARGAERAGAARTRSRCSRSSRSPTTGTRASPASGGATSTGSSTAARRRRSMPGACGTSRCRSTSRRCARARRIWSDATTSPPSARPIASRTAR